MIHTLQSFLYVRLLQPILGFLERIGAFVLFVASVFRLIFQKPFDVHALFYQMNEIGVKSLVMVSVSAIFTGMVIGLQLGVSMERIISGISYYLGGGISLGIAREIAPTFTSLLLAGRIGSSISAEIGSMKVTEQIDALQTLATNPIHYLVVPRLLASILMFPLLTVISVILSIIGTGFIFWFKLDIPLGHYIDNVKDFLTIADVMSGLIKTFFFGAAITLVSSYMGFQTSGGAAGVGKSTIKAVVSSYMAIIVSNYFLTYIFQLFNF